MEEWTQRINQVMDYIETHLADDINEKAICQIMNCSYHSFLTYFNQLTNITFNEYIRRRRLTCAAYDLQNTEERIIDIALKYGYQSADSFRIAFKRLHGITPSEARLPGNTLTFYCRLNFQIKIKGVDKINYEIVRREAFKVIGIRRVAPYGGGTWAIVKSNGSNEKIKEISGKFFDLGICFGFGEDGSNDYMCAIEWSGEEVAGFDTYEYKEATWLRFEAKGKISDNTLVKVWGQINHEFLPDSKYDKAGPTIEQYIIWNNAEDICHVDIWLLVNTK